MLFRIIANKFGMLVLGLAALGFGIFGLNQTDVTCGGEVMQAGDTCEHTKAGQTTALNSFDKEKSSKELSAKILTGVGGALTLGGATWIVVSRMRRKPQTEAQAPAAA
jgi:hypothetical protein